MVAILSVRDPILQDEFQDDGEDNEEDIEITDTKVETKRKTKYRWEHPESDILAALRAVGAWEYANESMAFSTSKGLHFPTLREISALRRQLNQMLRAVDPSLRLPSQSGASPSPHSPLSPPSAAQERQLRQLLTAAFADRVALREGSSYVTLRGVTALLPRASALRSAPPAWIVFRELRAGSKDRNWFRGSTAIEAAWLPRVAPQLCHWSAPMAQPPPRWDSQAEVLRCWRRGNFGPPAWPLPLYESEFPEGPLKYHVLARFLLDGILFPPLTSWKDWWATPPARLTSALGNSGGVAALPRTLLALPSQLRRKKIASCAALREQWKNSKTFLWPEVSQWLRPECRSTAAAQWPPL